MKRCAKCQKEYYDETLEFCLDDGSRLQKIDKINNETLTAPAIKPNLEIGQSKTVEMANQPEVQRLELPKTEILSIRQFSDKKEIIKRNVADTSVKILETSPIILALAHNYWQWLYLYRQPTYDLTAFFTSYNFLVWIFLLISGLLFGIFSLKYGKNNGFAITALVVLAINVILSIVPK
ncbi:hypothetical protein BH20ACI4_BH20ACI4_00650 [soil metagenome]